MHIYLVRHGETHWNIQRRTQGIKDIPLTAKGMNQAEELSRRLKKEPITKIYTSTLKRALSTAIIIGNKLDLTPLEMKELKEINFGVWEGLTIKQIEKKYPGQLGRYRTEFSFSPDKGESLSSLQQRIDDFIESNIKGYAYKEDSILIVSHSYPIRMLIVRLLGFPLQHLWDFDLDNTGITIIRYQTGRSRIVCLNDTCHLSKI